MKNKSILYNTIMNILLTLSNMLFPLISFAYATRVLSVQNIGRVNFYNNIGMYSVTLAGLGMGIYGIKACANRRDDIVSLSTCVKEIIIIKILSTMIVIVSILGISLFVTKLWESPTLLLIQIGYIGVNAFSIEWFFSGIEEYGFITRRAVAVRVITLLMLFIFVKNEKDMYIYSSLSLIAILITTVTNYAHAKKYIIFSSCKKVKLAQHIKPAFTLYGATLAVSVYTSLDVIMLGILSSDSHVGFYSVAIKVKTILLSLINSLSTVLLPRLSYYIKENREQEYNEILKKAVAIISWLSLPIVFCFELEAKATIFVIAGEKYEQAIIGMVILLPIVLFSGFSNILGNQILIPQNKESRFTQAVVSGAILDFVLNLYLIPKYGFVGAAISTLIAEFTQMLLQLHFAKKIVSRIAETKEIIKIVVASIVAMICAIPIKLHSTNTNLYCEIMIVFVSFFATYVLASLVLKVDIVYWVLNIFVRKIRCSKEDVTKF